MKSPLDVFPDDVMSFVSISSNPSSTVMFLSVFVLKKKTNQNKKKHVGVFVHALLLRNLIKRLMIHPLPAMKQT